jgi:CheY-like chemotaxis protein
MPNQRRATDELLRQRQTAGFSMPDHAGTALLVDDEEMIRLATADMLTELGFKVIEAASAKEALDVLRRGDPIDVLITDHLMPGTTGVELAHIVIAERPEVPVLIVSGFAEVEGLPSHLPRLSKPFRQADLATVLRGLIGGKENTHAG